MGYSVVVQLAPNGQMTTPRLDDSARDHRYLFAASNLAADRTVTFPLLAANANFVFDSFLNVFTVLQQFNAGIQMATSAILLDTLASAGVRIQDGGAEIVQFMDSTNARGIDFTLTAGGTQTIGTTTGALVIRTVGASNFDLQTNSVTRLSISGGGGGAITLTQGAAVAGAVALTITPGAHTAVIAEVNTILVNAQTITITGAYATQRFYYISTPTITAAGAITITTASTVEIQSAPQTAGSAAITNIYALNISGGALNINNIAGSSYRAIRTGAHTVTLTTATQLTADPSIAAAAFNIITIAQSGGAVTVDSAATIYIAGAPTNGAGVTLTSAYALFIDAGTARFDGRIEGGPAATSLTLAGSVTGGVPLQRDVVIQTGTAANPQVLTTRMTFNSNAASGSAGITSLEAITVPDGSGAVPGLRVTTNASGFYYDTQVPGNVGLGLSLNGTLRILLTTDGSNVYIDARPAATVNFAIRSTGNTSGRTILMGSDTSTSGVTLRMNSSGSIGTGTIVFADGADNSIVTITASGAITHATAALAGGLTAYTIAQANHTAVVAERPALVLSTASITLTDTTTIARYGWAVINAPTFVGVAAGGAEVITEAASLVITGAPIAGANITLTNASAILLLTAGAICFDSRANGGVRMYDGGAEVLNFFDSTNARGITFTLTAAGVQTIGTSAGNLVLTPITQFNNKLYPSTDAAALQTASGIYAGTGVPNNANGADGDFYFRSDGGASTAIYQRRAGVWVATAA